MVVREPYDSVTIDAKKNSMQFFPKHPCFTICKWKFGEVCNEYPGGRLAIETDSASMAVVLSNMGVTEFRQLDRQVELQCVICFCSLGRPRTTGL